MKREKVNETILVICIGLMVLFLLFENNWLIRLGVGIGILSLVFKQIGQLITRVWFQIAKILGFINSRIILSIIFFFFLFPIAIFARFFSKKDKLQLKKRKDTYFKNRNHVFEASDMDMPF